MDGVNRIAHVMDCGRSRRPAPPPGSDEFWWWEALDDAAGECVVVCPGCVTAEEAEALDADFGPDR
jgi:hypothetical protein